MLNRITVVKTPPAIGRTKERIIWPMLRLVRSYHAANARAGVRRSWNRCRSRDAITRKFVVKPAGGTRARADCVGPGLTSPRPDPQQHGAIVQFRDSYRLSSFNPPAEAKTSAPAMPPAGSPDSFAAPRGPA